jgi:hypothetical protein
VRAKTTTAGPELASAAGQQLDWQHAAVVQTAEATDAERLARLCFEGAPLLMRLFLTIGWRLLLLEGKPRSDATHIMGWPIASSSPGRVVLQRRSRLGIDATLVFSIAPETATFASGMAFSNRLARIVWAVVAPTHRWAVRSVLGHASTPVS